MFIGTQLPYLPYPIPETGIQKNQSNKAKEISITISQYKFYKKIRIANYKKLDYNYN